jgi:hypothetical protein
MIVVVVIMIVVVMIMMVMMVMMVMVMVVMVILGDDHRPLVNRGVRGRSLVLNPQNVRCVGNRVEQFRE